MRGSVRVRVTAAALIVVTLVLASSGIAVVTIQRSELEAALDLDVSLQLDSVESALSSARPDAVASRFASEDDEVRALQLVSPTGVAIASSPNLDDGAGIMTVASGLEVRTVDLPSVDDESFRAAGRRVQSVDGELIAVVALSTDDVVESTQTLTTALLVVLPMVLVLLGTVVWQLIGRTLRPVEAIRAGVAAVDSGDLHRRVPEPDSDDEIARLAATMNSMLGRLERSAERQRRFVGDASHELRGPLTRMRSALEVDRAHPQRADPDRTSAEMLEEVHGMERLVDDLLHLALGDAGQLSLSSADVDLDDIVLEECRRAAEGVIRIDRTAVSGAAVRGDRAQLRRVVRNLLDNAVRHARSTVVVELAEADGARLVISDDGAGIPAEDRAAVFERFTRLDASRTVGSGGTGLGLAIAQDIVERHGGTISVETAPTGGARFVVGLPPAGAADVDGADEG